MINMGLVHLFNILDSWDDFDDYRKVSLVAVTCSFAEASTGSFSNDEGDGSEDVTFKMNWRFFFNFVASVFQTAGNIKYRRISLELISWGPHSSFEIKRKIRCRLFTSSIKREIRDFHVVVVQ